MFSKMFSDVKANDAPMVLGKPIGLLTDLFDRNYKPWGSYSKYLWRRQLYPYGIVLMSGRFSLTFTKCKICLKIAITLLIQSE